jgi:glycine/D-amino acid oxidase-like deaminating enzyme
MQGCCVALELAKRGVNVRLFERTAMPMQATSRSNEGKIHLGYTYAKDAGLATARMMVRGALRFNAFLQRHLGDAATWMSRSTPFVYGVHRESQIGVCDVAAHFAAVDRLVAEERVSGVADDYLGETGLPLSRPIPVERHFDPALVQAAFETPERAIDPRVLCDGIVTRVLAEPRIEFCGDHHIERVERVGDQRYRVACEGSDWITGFHHVVNASWTSRLVIDSAFGLQPLRPWLYRYKYGMHITQSAAAVAIPSVTLVLGPFGDIVDYGNGAYYVSWYPTGRTAISAALAPSPADIPPSALAGEAMLESMRQLVPSLRGIDLASASSQIVGGWIFAWGETDIDDTSSMLHRRDEVGVSSVSGYHTINTGKLALAPLHAMTTCDLIAPLN